MILLVFTCLSFKILHAGNLHDESNFWPPKVKLNQELKLDSSEEVLPTGRHGVLIRVEQDEGEQDVLIVDFGSDGIHRLKPEQTNVFELVQKYKKGQEHKSFPNWTMMIGRAFVYVDKDSVRPIKLKEISGYKYMLFVYDDALNSEKMDHLSQNIRTYSEALEDANVLVVVLPASNLSGRVSYQEIQAICKRYDLGLYYVYPYLSNAYILSLKHEISVYPSCVLTDAEGKTIWISEYEEDVSLRQILQQLN